MDILPKLEGASSRRRRLYAIASYWLLKGEVPWKMWLDTCDEHVRYARDIMADAEWSPPPGGWRWVLDARKSAMLSTPKKYRKATMVCFDLAALAVSPDVSTVRLAAIAGQDSPVMAPGAWRDLGFDREVAMTIQSPTADMVGLARELYKNWDRRDAAILSDACEDADAPDDLVRHLREPGRHWRGCWALDAILGKS